MFSVQSLAAMTVSGMLPELQCDQGQLVCPSQNITCQCVVTGTAQTITWRLGLILIAQFNQEGETLISNANYPATFEVLENGLSSNVSLPADLKSDPVTVECLDATFKSSTWSYSIFGLFLEVAFAIIEVSNNSNFLCNTEKPGPPVINMATALNSSSANISWTPPSYNCSFTYILEIANEDNVSVSLSDSSIIVTTLMLGKTYSFRVASVDAAERVSNWSQPVLLAMQGLLSVFTRLAMNSMLCCNCHGHAEPAPVEIVTATIKTSLQTNYSSVTAVWKVICYHTIFCTFAVTSIHYVVIFSYIYIYR